MATVAFKDLPTQITETLDRLRLAREVGDKDTVRIAERRLDYLLDQVKHDKETP